MKSTRLILIVTAIAGLFLQSCRKGSMWGIRGEGDKITQTFDLKDFNAIDLSSDADILYVQDSLYSIEVTAQRNILSVMDIKLSGSELEIGTRRNIMDHDGVRIVIHSPNMVKINISGSGNIDVKNQLKGTSLDLMISGSGSITSPSVSLEALRANISGSGDIKLYGGTCKSESFNISGSGSIDAEFVSALTAEVKISGVGDVRVNASESLNVDISGSGDVRYKGRPAITSNLSGIGRLIHM